jgi:hypothetical protein
LYVTFIVEIAPSLSMVLSTHYIQSILRGPTQTAVQTPLERSLPSSIELHTAKLSSRLQSHNFAAITFATFTCSLWRVQSDCSCGRDICRTRPAPIKSISKCSYIAREREGERAMALLDLRCRTVRVEGTTDLPTPDPRIC